MEAGEVHPASLFLAHQVGYSWIVWCEACPTSFSEILSPLRHEASRPQIFLTVCFISPYCEVYTRRASVPPGGPGKEEEEREMETSELARGLPSCSGQDPKGGGLSLAFVRAGDSSGGGGGGRGVMSPPWRFSLSRFGVPRRRVPLPLLQCRTRWRGIAIALRLQGMRTLCFLMRSSLPGLFPPSYATPTSGG